MKLFTFFSKSAPPSVLDLLSLRFFFHFFPLHILLWHMIFSSHPTKSQELTGVTGCKGFDLLSSRYCGFLGNSVLGPFNFTKPLQALFLTNQSTVSILGTKFTIDFANIHSAAEFDTTIMENVVLPKLDYLTNQWFHCSFRELGVEWLSSWFCNIMFNLRVPGSKEPCFAKGVQLPLCASTRDETLLSVEQHYYQDKSCDTSEAGKAKFQAHFNDIKKSFQASPDFDGQKGTCLEGRRMEAPNGYCGWANTELACDTRKKVLKKVLEEKSHSKHQGLIIGLSAGGVALLFVVSSFLVWKFYPRKLKTSNAHKPSLEEVPRPPQQQQPPPPSRPMSAGLRSPAPLMYPSGVPSTFTFYDPRDAESILPDDSASNIGGYNPRSTMKTQLSRIMVDTPHGPAYAITLPSPARSTPSAITALD